MSVAKIFFYFLKTRIPVSDWSIYILNFLAGKSAACQGCPNQLICAAAGPAQPDPDIDLIAQRLQGVKHKVGAFR
jgi:hypothetical protein